MQGCVHPLHQSVREREREKEGDREKEGGEIERKRGREREGGGGRERVIKRERKIEGMPGALAPFSCLILKRMTAKHFKRLKHQRFQNSTFNLKFFLRSSNSSGATTIGTMTPSIMTFTLIG